VAYCHLREQVRTFALFRIAAAQCADTPFHTPRNFMQYCLADAFDGLQSTGEPVRVVFRIGKDAPLFIRDRQWSTHERRTAAPDGTVRIEFQTAALFAVEREIRAADGWVELLEPAESRARLRIGGQAIAKAHQ